MCSLSDDMWRDMQAAHDYRITRAACRRRFRWCHAAESAPRNYAALRAPSTCIFQCIRVMK
jgi:hypothetical protein